MNNSINSKDAGKINAVSPCFCLAKWLQVTVDLVQGTTHSCHHPKRHLVPLEELAENPGALHNTSFKKEQRRRMLAGDRPEECGYCWEMEDSGSAYSDRIIKSTDPWALPHLDRVKAMPWNANIDPTYLEVMLDDLCNFSCMYCSANISTSVAAEIRKFGPYPVTDPTQRARVEPRPEGENPYLVAFWKWLPTLLPKLQVLRVTGGEPLLSPHFEKLLDFIERQDGSALTLVINSHLSHREVRFDSAVARIKRLLDQSKIGHFEIYTSVDAYGAQAEYIRHGLSYALLLKNIERAATAFPQSNIVLMTTFNILSIASFKQLIDDVHRLKNAHPHVSLDISYLRNPGYLRADMASPDLQDRLWDALDHMKTRGAPCFSPHEVGKLENVIAWMTQKKSVLVTERNRRDFLHFINEYDRRKNKSFLKIFPEYRDFTILCKKAAFELAGTQSTLSP